MSLFKIILNVLAKKYLGFQIKDIWKYWVFLDVLFLTKGFKIPL